MTNRDPYARLLRWYPEAWRDAHGAVFLDTLREQSEHEGRTGPSGSERFAAMVSGLGARLDARVAASFALAGIALVAISQLVAETLTVIVLTAPQAPLLGTPITLTNMMFLVYFGATALLVMASMVPPARAYGLISGARALLVLTVGSAALTLATAAQYARAISTIPPDENAASGLADAWVPLAGAAIVLGVVASWVYAEGLLGRTGLTRLPRFGLAALATVVLVPVVEFAIIDQQIWVAVGLVVVGLSLRSVGAWPKPEAARGAPRHRRLVRALAGVSAVTGLFGIVYALSGATWSPLASDGTTAGAQAVVICLVGALPLVVVWGLRDGRHAHAVQVWGPALVLGLAVGITTYAYGYNLVSGPLEPFLYVSSAVLACALAWWVASIVAGTGRDRWVAGASIALACVAADGAALLPVAAFVTPLLAVILAVRGDLRRHRTMDDQSAEAAPLES
jgi:hypothetical protein